MKLGDFFKKVAFFEEVNLVTLTAVAAVIAVARFEFSTDLLEIPVEKSIFPSSSNLYDGPRKLKMVQRHTI